MLEPAAWGAIVVFAVALLLVARWERYRAAFALGGAALVVAIGWVPISSLVPTTASGTAAVIDWNTLGLIVGVLLFAALLGTLGLFRAAAVAIAARTEGRPVVLYASLTLLAAVLSAFVNAIAVMILLAAVTLEIARHAGQNPIPLLLAEISAANIGGTMTLIGNPPNLILGEYFGYTFLDFLLYAALPALAALVVVLYLFSRQVDRLPPETPLSLPPLRAEFPLARTAATLGVFTVLLLFLSVPGGFGVPVWVIGLVGGLLALALSFPRYTRMVVRSFDGEIVLFLLGLFVLVGSLVTTGAVDAFADGLASIGTRNLLVMGSILFWTLAIVSAFIDNIPLAAVAGPLIARLSAATGLAVRPLVFASALGLGIGGSGSPIGSASNIVALSAARRGGVTIDWPTYLKRALPITFAALAIANLVWLFLF
ncbi:MAG: SLC13 family permease [Thermoplasmata archaeon]